MTEKVLVTGATGFVGSAVVRRLALDSNRTVVATVRSLHSDLPKQVQVVPGLVLDEQMDWQAVLQGVTSVVHCAARAHVLREALAAPLAEYRRMNVQATLALARNAAEAGVKRFVFISSIGVNGKHTTARQPFNESDQPAPHDAYALSKHEAELGLATLAKDSGMEVVILRPPLVYGAGAPGNFGRLLHWVRKGVPLPLGAVRNNRRSLVGLDNLVDLIVTCIDHPAAANQVFLAGDGEDLSTAELLERVGRAMGRRALLLPVPICLLQTGATMLGKGEMAQRLLGSLQVDITKAREVLGWTPPVSVDEGLQRTVGGKRW